MPPRQRPKSCVYIAQILPRILTRERSIVDLGGEATTIAACDRQLVYISRRLEFCAVPGQGIVSRPKPVSAGKRLDEFF